MIYEKLFLTFVLSGTFLLIVDRAMDFISSIRRRQSVGKTRTIPANSLEARLLREIMSVDSRANAALNETHRHKEILGSFVDDVMNLKSDVAAMYTDLWKLKKPKRKR